MRFRALIVLAVSSMVCAVAESSDVCSKGEFHGRVIGIVSRAHAWKKTGGLVLAELQGTLVEIR